MNTVRDFIVNRGCLKGELIEFMAIRVIKQTWKETVGTYLPYEIFFEKSNSIK